ncbi:MAG: SAM hydrolase/SAM-dependent halogenase family protein [Actinomycetota bacterium]
MPRPIALLTDFGLQDAYVGILKGVILSRCPDARFIDLSHAIPPQDICAGALCLASAAPYCPPDTVFLAVVDPGVGSDRRAICLEVAGRLFVGPDNGLLWPAAARLGEVHAFHLDRPEFWLPEPSSTFHGRDIFAPVTAHLARSVAPACVGSPLADPVELSIPEPLRNPDRISGEVIYVDHFGNAITNLRPRDLVGQPLPAVFEVTDQFIFGPANCYIAVQAGLPTIVLGSWGYFEVAIRDGSAALLLGLQRGSPVSVTFPAGRIPVNPG